METLYDEAWNAVSLQNFVASGYLYQLNGLNDIAKSIKDGNNETAASQLFDLYYKNLNKGIGQVFKPDSSNPQHRDYYYKMQANACKFATYKAEYFKNALQKAYEKNPNEYDANAKKILQAANRFQITEYNTTVARCRTARQFNNFKQNKDLFPNIEWLRTRSATPRELHLSYVGLILPMDDPFWQENQPGNLYGCKCDWRQTDKPATNKPNTTVPPSRGLEGNPTNTREVFTEKHTYFTKATDEEKEQIDKLVSEQVYKQFEKTDGYFVHPLQNKKANDFNDLCAISKHFVKEKKDVFI
ncbi:MAG: phage head morphogenesis protein, partial [Lentimicrobiaceae bacterium]|nr:phage head morphogenesis protein [Lentimicrobiaceae bacterium]